MALASGAVEVEPSSRGMVSRVKTKGSSGIAAVPELPAGLLETADSLPVPEPPADPAGAFGPQAVSRTAAARIAGSIFQIYFIKSLLLKDDSYCIIFLGEMHFFLWIFSPFCGICLCCEEGKLC